MRLADRSPSVPRPLAAGRGVRLAGVAVLGALAALLPGERGGAVRAAEPAGTPVEGAVVPGAPGTRTLYRWKDERGVTHWSDRPRPGAEPVVVAGAQGFRAPSPARSVPSGGGASAPAGPVYRSVAVARPASDQVFVNDPTPIELAAAVEPALRSGHQIWFYVDGQRVSGRSPAVPGTSVQQLPRGSHTVIARVVDESGTTVASSAPVTFHVRQTSIAQPPVGPLLRPPGTGAPNRPAPLPAPRP